MDVDRLQKLAASWRSMATALRGEVARGIALRQSAESKLARADVLESCADSLARDLAQPVGGGS